MSETIQGIFGMAALIPSVVFGWCSWIGGRSKKYFGIPQRIWKRIIAPIAFVSLAVLLSVIAGKSSFWYLAGYATYWASCTFGYGNEYIAKKLYRRSFWSIARTTAALPFAVVTGAWSLLALQAIIGLSSTLILGILNPLKAPAEEGKINFLSVVSVPYMVI